MDIAVMRAQIERLQTQLETLRDGRVELERQLAELRITVTSVDEFVSVTVDARGQVERVELDSRIYQRPDSRLLAATITATIQQAAGEAMARVLELTRPFMPEELLRAHMNLDLDEVLRLRNPELVEG